jgi:outer membrane protein
VHKVGALLIWLILCSSANALNFEELLKQTESLDPQIASAEAAKLSALERMRINGNIFSPNINAGFNALQFYSNLKGVPGVESGNQGYSASTASLSMVQPIYSPVKKINLEESSIQATAEDLQVGIIRNEILIKLVQVLFEFAASEASIDFAEAESAKIRALMKIAKEAPSESDTSYYTTRLYQAEGQAKLSRNLNLQRKRDLKRLTGSDLPNGWRITWESKNAAPIEIPALEELMRKAEFNNLQIRLQQSYLQQAVLSIKRTAYDQHPSANLIANGTVMQGMPNLPRSRTESASIGIQVNIPLRDGGITSIMNAEAISQESRARNSVEATKKAVQQNISDLYHDYLTLTIQLGTENKLRSVQEDQKRARGAAPPLEESAKAIMEIEEEISRLTSTRELERLKRESLIQLLRLWSVCGPLEPSQINLISQYFGN